MHLSCPTSGCFASEVEALNSDPGGDIVNEGLSSCFQGRVDRMFGCLARKRSVGPP